MVVFILQDKYVVCDNQALFTLERIYSGINVIFSPKKILCLYIVEFFHFLLLSLQEF